MSRVCPACEKPDGLWETVEVQAWQAVTVETDGRVVPTTDTGWNDREVEWHSISTRWGQGGCTCGWTGSFKQLIRYGLDGKPLKDPLPGQMEIAS